MTDPKRIRPFSNGSQFCDWQSRNCDRCTKYVAGIDDISKSVCEIDIALGKSMWGDGSVSEEIGERMGYGDPLAYNWDCTEREMEDTDEQV